MEETQFIKHIAGSYDNDTKIQICKLCGAVLADYNGIMYVGSAPSAWEEDSPVYINGGFMTVDIIPGTKVSWCSILV